MKTQTKIFRNFLMFRRRRGEYGTEIHGVTHQPIALRLHCGKDRLDFSKLQVQPFLLGLGLAPGNRGEGEGNGEKHKMIGNQNFRGKKKKQCLSSREVRVCTREQKTQSRNQREKKYSKVLWQFRRGELEARCHVPSFYPTNQFKSLYSCHLP
jgi:hypothetical protein